MEELNADPEAIVANTSSTFNHGKEGRINFTNSNKSTCMYFGWSLMQANTNLYLWNRENTLLEARISRLEALLEQMKK